MQHIPSTMRASVLLKAGELEIQNRPVPDPQPGDVLVKVGSVGICGSDTHFYHDGRLGNFVVEKPIVLGHECGGTVVAVGEGVSSSRVGERVAIEPQRPDFTSVQSRTGVYNLDPSVEFFAAPPVDGAFQEYVTVPAVFAHPIPDSMTEDAAALMEPLSVAIQGVRKAQVTAGDRVLISGAGPIGIMLTQVALSFGATEVIVSDIDAARRERALSFGATETIDAGSVDVSGLGLGVDAFIDASGATPAVVSGIKNVRPNGRAVLVGLGATEMPLPVIDIMNLEITLTGIYRYANTWPTAIALTAAGRISTGRFVTARFGLDAVAAAFEESTKSESLKVIVRPGE
ncbi:NAD(P)-dependent alcohol dehydrogenase [Okibacterium endophyticum]